MRFEWDEDKREANFANHGIDFADVPHLLESETWTTIDDRFDYGETRYYTLGLLSGRVIAVIHTEQDDVTRIISARKAKRNEAEKYFKEIRD